MPRSPEENTEQLASKPKSREPLSRPEFLFRTIVFAGLVGIAGFIGVHHGAQDGADTVDKAKAELGSKLDTATGHLDAAKSELTGAQAACKKLDQYGPELQAIADALRQDEQPLDGETTTTTAPAQVQPTPTSTP